MAPENRDVFAVGSAYEAYIGRWSRPVALEFVRWLGVAPGKRWLDVGCGTGALSEVLLEVGGARSVVGVDRSAGFVRHARERSRSAELTFLEGDAQALPVPSDGFDAVVSGLVLNFVPEPPKMVAEMVRAAGPGSSVALYVWDLSGGMEIIARFWEGVTSVDPSATTAQNEAYRLREICAPGPLRELFAQAGLEEVETRAIDLLAVFRDFDDYWLPFLGGQGPTPAYLMSLPAERRAAVRDALRRMLPAGPDGSIRLNTRAWAVRGRKPA